MHGIFENLFLALHLKDFFMLRKLNRIPCVLILLLFGGLIALGQQDRGTTFSNVARNNLAPDLYSETLDFRITLVNLPGVDMQGSQWQTSYEIYFVPEADFDDTVQKIGRREPIPRDFSEKVLLATGSFNKNLLKELSRRIVEKNAVSFKTKIPNRSKTEFAKIITFFSAKIYDAKLKKNIFKTGLFISPPFTPNGSQKVPLRKLFLSFFVNNEGELYTSNQERGKSDTSW